MLRQFVTGESVWPLSHRDMWILSRAESFMRVFQSRDPYDDIFLPAGYRYRRHVLDWLRVPTEDMEPHFRHTEVAVAAEMDESSEYSSDEDDPGCASD